MPNVAKENGRSPGVRESSHQVDHRIGSDRKTITPPLIPQAAEEWLVSCFTDPRVTGAAALKMAFYIARNWRKTSMLAAGFSNIGGMTGLSHELARRGARALADAGYVQLPKRQARNERTVIIPIRGHRHG